MSTIVCAISGNAPDEPVFSPKTGHVYEKRVIEKQIDGTGKCPVTKEELSKDDLIEMKVNKAVKPRPGTATSIPGMLTMLQSEWDALMSETYELKTNLDTTRKQLSHALYQHDAACRVIARLLRERDAKGTQVVQLQEQLANSMPTGSVAAPEGETGLTPAIIGRMEECAKELSKKRKQRNFPDLNPVDDVKRFASVGSHAIHQSTAPGILCVDVHKADSNRVVTGGVDSQVILFDAGREKVAQKLSGHSKKVTAVQFHSAKNVIVSASEDATAKIWACSSASNWSSPYSCAHTIKKHQAEITDVSIHPVGDYLLTSSRDKSFAIHDLMAGRCIKHMEVDSEYTCMNFHPDGLIMAGGNEDKKVVVYDVKEQTTVATLDGHEDSLETISFSGNGYYLASGSRDGVVKLWDLRKPLNIQTLKVDGPVRSVQFDVTGHYLAVASAGLQVYNFATKSSLAETVSLKDHTAEVMGVCWGPNAKTMASVSMDRTLKLYKTK